MSILVGRPYFSSNLCQMLTIVLSRFPWAGGDSRNHLKITRSMFLRILSYHQVMANYLDFISVFGVQDEPRDLRFSGFREYITLGQSAKTTGIHALGRSGRQYQLCFNLKGVSQVPIPNKPGQKRWSIRQAAIHHQFDVEFGTTLWIITKGNKDLKERIEDMTAPPPYGRIEDQSFGTPEECFKSSLAVHLLLCNWSTEEWRWYIQYLEISIEEEVTSCITIIQIPRLTWHRLNSLYMVPVVPEKHSLCIPPSTCKVCRVGRTRQTRL